MAGGGRSNKFDIIIIIKNLIKYKYLKLLVTGVGVIDEPDGTLAPFFSP